MCIAGLRYETLTVASTMSPRDPPVGRQHPSFAYIDCIERWCLHFSPCGWGDLTQPGVTYGTSSWIAFGIHLYHVSKTLLSQQKDSQKKVMQSPLSHPKYKKMTVIGQIVWLFWPRSTLGRYPNQIAWYRLVVRYASLLLSEDRPREAKELLKEARRLGLMSCSVWIFSFSNGCVYESNG